MLNHKTKQIEATVVILMQYIHAAIEAMYMQYIHAAIEATVR